MSYYDELLEVFDKLMGPQGCPWDKAQTFTSLQPYLLEEAHELIEAVDHENTPEIIEEIGDILNVVLFYCKIAENKNIFTTKDVFEALKEKLIRRHPHIFAGIEAADVDEVIRVWTEAKDVEKASRKTALEGIPKTLDILQRAQKVTGRLMKAKFLAKDEKVISEENLGLELLALVKRAEVSGIDAMLALKSILKKTEDEFSLWEKNSDLKC